MYSSFIAAVVCVSMVTWEVECVSCVCDELFASVLSLFLHWAAHPVLF